MLRACSKVHVISCYTFLVGFIHLTGDSKFNDSAIMVIARYVHCKSTLLLFISKNKKNVVGLAVWMSFILKTFTQWFSASNLWFLPKRNVLLWIAPWWYFWFCHTLYIYYLKFFFKMFFLFKSFKNIFKVFTCNVSILSILKMLKIYTKVRYFL